MATFTWNTGSGSFSSGVNWSPSGPPGAADTALFNANSGTVSGNGTVGALSVTGGSPWVWTGTVAANNFTANATSTISGAGLWTLTGTPTSSNYLVIGSGTGGQGSLTVSGGGKITSTQAASTAAYGLYVGSGTSSTANGTLVVTGAGSSVNTGPNAAAVGQGGTGTMTVTAGATATFSTADSSALAALAVGRAGAGTVNVTAGSTVTANGYVYVGRAGTGALNLDSGSTFTGGSAASGSTSAYSVAIGDGTPSQNSSGQPDSPLYFGGSGAAAVTNGSTLHSLGNVLVGNRGTTGRLTIDTSSTALADGGFFIGNGADRTGGNGTVTVQGGGTLLAGTVANASGSIVLGNNTGTTGSLTVTGTGSKADAHGYRLTVGSSGTGSLTVSGGGTVTSASTGYSDTEAALAVAGSVGSTGAVTITGAGSSLIANGIAVIGGGNKGSGITAGGAGTVSVASGGTLQTGAMTIEANSSLTVDQSSSITIPSITIDGGTADLYSLSASNSISFGAGGTLRVHQVAGMNSVGNFSFGDQIDFAGTKSVTLSGNTVTAGAGSITLASAPANAGYQLFDDGSGGTFVALSPQTIGVYRFFDTTYGTHFYTADANEAQTVAATRSDLVPEGPGGIGLQAVAVSSSDPNAAPVYRFFDTVFGTHFFTASATERDSIIASRPDLTYEPSSTFYEHTQQEPGDIAVYRFFDNVHGTHFYTDDAAERASIIANRPDLISEGVGFYEPPKNNATAAT